MLLIKMFWQALTSLLHNLFTQKLQNQNIIINSFILPNHLATTFEQEQRDSKFWIAQRL